MRRPGSPLALASLLLFSMPLAAQGSSDASIAEILKRLTGTFDSQEQAVRDAAFQNVRVVGVEVPRSRIGLGAKVVYIEEAEAGKPDRPFRQRFYLLVPGEDGSVSLRLYEPQQAILVAGKWRDPSDLALFGDRDLRERKGCTITLRRGGSVWEGATAGSLCASSVRGATTTTSHLALHADRIEWWDRGFDASGRKVWGPSAGPTVYVKRSDSTPIAAASPVQASPPAPTAPAQAGSVRIFGMGLEKTFTGSELEARARGGTVSVLGLLKELGLKTESMSDRRLLANAILVARASDGYEATFALDELFEEGRVALTLAQGRAPSIAMAASRIRSVRDVKTLELRLLSTNPPETKP